MRSTDASAYHLCAQLRDAPNQFRHESKHTQNADVCTEALYERRLESNKRKNGTHFEQRRQHDTALMFANKMTWSHTWTQSFIIRKSATCWNHQTAIETCRSWWKIIKAKVTNRCYKWECQVNKQGEQEKREKGIDATWGTYHSCAYFIDLIDTISMCDHVSSDWNPHRANLDWDLSSATSHIQTVCIFVL